MITLKTFPLKTIAAFVLFTFIGCFPVSAHAIEFGDTGNTFLLNCREPIVEAASFYYCSGVVRGITAMLDITQSRKTVICLPEGVSNAQVIQVAAQYMQTQPKYLHWAQEYLILASLIDAFPCAKAR